MKHFVIHSLLALLPFLLAADWPEFRGADGSSVAQGPVPPTEFDLATGRNIAWSVDLPGRAASGAIVVAGRVFVTASSGANQDRLHVFAFDAATGDKLWERRFWATGRTFCHPTSAIAAPTPASDGKRVFAFYSSNDLVCLDLDGNLQWLRGLTYDYPTAANDVGMASSPIVFGDLVIVQVENLGESFAAGIDTTNGTTRWRIDRTKQMNWSSPTLLHDNGRNLLVLQAPDGLAAYEPDSGNLLWKLARKCEGIPSPLCVGSEIFIPSDGVTALKAVGVQEPTVLWSENKLAIGNGSPVEHDGKLYILNRAGAISCADAKSGEVGWRLRVKGTYWATPIIIGDTMYVANYDGLVTSIKLGDKGEIIAESSLGEPILGSPAIADGAMYLRSDKHLWKIAN
jgi:outer membrane protein assembly factor BamB